jgi:hypothetical protein
MARQVLPLRRWFVRQIKTGIPMTDTKSKTSTEKDDLFKR